jgi:hypothetical protein
MNDYIQSWEDKPEEIKRLTDQGVVPMMKDMEDEKDVDLPFLMGQVSGIIAEIKPAKDIVEEMVTDAVKMLELGQTYVGKNSRL